MKHVLMTIAANIASIVCIGIAGYMAIEGKPNWGWFLALGFLAITTINVKGK